MASTTSRDFWNPAREVTTLRDAVSQIFEQAVMRPDFNPWVGGGVGQMNVAEVGNRYYCQVLLPGASADSIDLTAKQNTLTIKAKLPELLPEELRKNALYLLHEFGAGEFSRAITLPKDIDGEHIEARYSNGVLSVLIPVAEHAQPKRITIREGYEGGQEKLSDKLMSGKLVEEQAQKPEPAQVN